MKKLLGILVPLALGASSLLMTPAATAAMTTDNDVVLSATDQSHHRNECSTDANFRIGLTGEVTYDDWSAEVTVTSPTGAIWQQTTLMPGASIGAFGTWCGYRNASGAYQVHAVFTGHVAGGSNVTRTLDTTLTMTLLPDVITKVQVHKEKLGKKKWLIAGRLLREGTPWKGKRVTLQILYRGTWGDVIGSATNKYGVVAFTAKPNPAFRGKKFRLHFTGSGYVRSSNSTTFKLPPR